MCGAAAPQSAEPIASARRPSTRMRMTSGRSCATGWQASPQARRVYAEECGGGRHSGPRAGAHSLGRWYRHPYSRWPELTGDRRGKGQPVDFDRQLDELQKHVSEVQTTVKTAAREDHEQLKRRIDKAQSSADQALSEGGQQATQTAQSAEAQWAQMKADAASKMKNFKQKADQRANQLDAKVASNDADWAEADAVSAIDYADWAVENARLAVLDAIDARVYADQRLAIAGSPR